MGFISFFWACPLQVGLRLQVLASLWALRLRPHAFFNFSLFFSSASSPKKTPKKGSKLALVQFGKGITSRLRLPLPILHFSRPFYCFLFFRFFFWGCVCVGGAGVWLGLVFCCLFFCFAHGGFFFFFSCSSCVGRAPFVGCSLRRFLWLSFRPSSACGLVRCCVFCSCVCVGFLRLRWWRLRFGACLVSVCVGLSRVCVWLGRAGVRSSLGAARSVRRCVAFAFVGFLSWSRLSSRACSLPFPFAVLRGVRLGFVGFVGSCGWFGRSCSLVSSCSPRSSCVVWVCFVGAWLVFSPLVL